MFQFDSLTLLVLRALQIVQWQLRGFARKYSAENSEASEVKVCLCVADAS